MGDSILSWSAASDWERKWHSLPPKIKGTSVFLHEVQCMGTSGMVLDWFARGRLTTIVSTAALSFLGLLTEAASGSFFRFGRADRLLDDGPCLSVLME